MASSGKWLELLKEIAPRMMRMAVLRDPVAVGIGQFGRLIVFAMSYKDIEYVTLGSSHCREHSGRLAVGT
jgi:hypothetical protein